MKRGFTLVELSIVLVIIGLLIGGILVAQSMIQTARIQNLIRSIQQYDVAITDFRNKYKYLPGDSPSFGGNGNSLIEPVGGAGNESFSAEIAKFWVSLQQGGDISFPGKTFTSTVSGSGVDTKSNTPNAPAVLDDLGSKSSILVTTCTNFSDPNATVINCYQIGDYSNTTFMYAGAPDGTVIPIYKYVTYLAIDNKIDDGNTNTGFVTNSVGVDYPGDGQAPYLDPGQYCGPGNDGIVPCYMRIEILNQTGASQ